MTGSMYVGDTVQCCADGKTGTVTGFSYTRKQVMWVEHYTGICRFTDFMLMKKLTEQKKEKEVKSYVNVKFASYGTTYTYIADGSVDELSSFTHAVVNAPGKGFTVVDIVGVAEIDTSSYTGKYKDVVALFSINAYNEKQEREKRKAGLEKELRARVAKKKLEDNFEVLLNGDEEGMKLLKEYKSL